MEVFYGKNLIKNDQFLKISETKNEPEIKLSINLNDLYTLIFYDPDAVGGTYIHWVKVNISNSDIKTGNIIIPYKGPSPPPKTGKHHYIFNLYKQSELSNLVTLNERLIEIDELENRLDLSNPIYRVQFISENKYGGKSHKIITKRKNKKSKKISRKKYK